MRPRLLSIANLSGLQWGRGSVAAEMRPWELSSHRPGALQWGRGSVAAEITALAFLQMLYMRQLQWGRGSVAAEIRYRKPYTTPEPRASMGPRLGGRGDRSGRGLAMAGWTASMGPRLGGRGDVRHERFSTFFTPCFNGAAARWPRR